MRRRSRAGPERAKSRHRKTITQKHRALRNPSEADHKKQSDVAQLTRERNEALEREKATAEVLRVISSSPGELEPVFQTMLANAMRICEAKFGIMYEFANGAFRALSSLGVPPAYFDFVKEPRVWGPDTGLGLLSRTKQTVHVLDACEGRAYTERDPGRMAALKLGGVRTLVNVPMLKEGALIGAMNFYRQEVRPFTDRQIELVQNFAAQAVIAIENTRLLNELRQRTTDLSEALEQQTATSEVLGVISSSPGELEPVFQKLLEKATRICTAKFGFMWRIEGDSARIISKLGIPQAMAEYLQLGPHRPALNKLDPLTALSRVIQSRQTVHIADYRADPSYIARGPATVAAIELGRARTLLVVPMLKDRELIGAIGIYRQEVRPFTDKQIELVKNFANQAVIAIENTRLLNELRESLQQQTASADVLKVISSSPGELEPVFQAMLANAMHICDAKFGILFEYADGAFCALSSLGVPPAFDEHCRQRRVWGSHTGLGQIVRTKQPAHILDVREQRAFAERDPNRVAAVEMSGMRTIVVVPMLKEGELVGAFSIYRQEVRAFTDKQIELLQNFADQAVIAIENTRLLNELRESLQQQTATADVLKVISRSTFDLQPIFDTLVENAVTLCEAERAFLFRFDGKLLRSVACHNVSPKLRDWVDRNPIAPGRHSVSARAALERRTVQVADIQADPEFAYAAQDEQPIRTVLAVPMLKGDELVGTITIYRLELKPFTDNQIALVETFADQAVIAIENTRLLSELRESLQQQTATADVLKVISRSAFDLQAVLNTLVESAARLCEADMVV